jgi:FHS family glucose/mannose:H+ symporter-like MFS transporter
MADGRLAKRPVDDGEVLRRLSWRRYRIAKIKPKSPHRPALGIGWIRRIRPLPIDGHRVRGPLHWRIWPRPDHHLGQYPRGPQVAAWLLPRFTLRVVLEGFAGLFAAGVFILSIQMRTDQSIPKNIGGTTIETAPNTGLGSRQYLYFAALLVLYGGLETCLSGWLTTFALRYGDKTLAVSEYTTLLLWMALTFGRLGASATMLRIGEKTVQRWSLALAAIFTAALAMSHSAITIAVFAVLLGLSLAPFFPATFAMLMAERPTARQAGIVVAVSGLGAAALPWTMGVVSSKTGSLQLALILPFAAALGLLAMSLFTPRAHHGAD